MSLEEALAANTAALIANTAALTGGAVKAAPAAKASATKATTKATEPVATPEVPAGAPLKKVTEDFMHLANTYGRDGAVSLLGKYGATKCSLVPADKLAAFHAEVLKATEAAKAKAEGDAPAEDDLA